MRIHRPLRDFRTLITFLELVVIFSSSSVNCSSLDLVKVFELPICCYTSVVGNHAESPSYSGRGQPVVHNGQNISSGFGTVLATASSNVHDLQKQVRTDTDSEPASGASASVSTLTSTPNSALQFDSSRFYKLIVSLTTKESSKDLEVPRLVPLRRKREAVQKPESAKSTELPTAEAEDRSIAAFNGFDSVYTPLEEDAAVQLPSNWLAKLQSALFQSMVMQSGTGNTSAGAENHEETASSNLNSRSSTVPEEMVKSSESLWQKIANASWEVIEPYTKRVVAKLPTTISGKITGVMVNNPQGIQLHMSATSNKMKRTVDAEAHMEIRRGTRQLGVGGSNSSPGQGPVCDCHLIHHGDIPLAYYSIAHTQNEVGNDQLEYVVFPVTHNVPTPPRLQKFVSNDLTVIHRPSEVDYTAEVMKMNQKRSHQSQNSRLKRRKKKHSRNQYQKQHRYQIPQYREQEDESTPPKGAYPSVPDILREMKPYASPTPETDFPYEFDQEPYQYGTEASPSYATSYYYSSPNIPDQKSAHEHSSQQLQPFVYPPPTLPGGYFHFYHQKQVVQPQINNALTPDAHGPPPPLFLPPPAHFLLNPHLNSLPPPPPHPFLTQNHGFRLGLPNSGPLPLPPPYLTGPGGPQIPRPPFPPANLGDSFDGRRPPLTDGGQISPYSEFEYPKSIQEIISNPHPHRFQIPGAPFGGAFGYNSTRLRGDKLHQPYNDFGFDDCRDDAHWGTVNTKRRRMIPTSALASGIVTSDRLQRCREKYIRSRYASPSPSSDFQDLGKSSSGSNSIRFPRDDNEILASDHGNSELPNSKVVTASYTVDF